VAEYKRQNEKENKSDDECKKLNEDFHELLKQQKELDVDRKQVIHRILSEYDGSKKQQLELMVEHFDAIYELYVHYHELYDETGCFDKKEDESFILYKAMDDGEVYLTKLWNRITAEFLS
jgi:hypothetical protein